MCNDFKPVQPLYSCLDDLSTESIVENADLPQSIIITNETDHEVVVDDTFHVIGPSTAEKDTPGPSAGDDSIVSPPVCAGNDVLEFETIEMIDSCSQTSDVSIVSSQLVSLSEQLKEVDLNTFDVKRVASDVSKIADNIKVCCDKLKDASIPIVNNENVDRQSSSDKDVAPVKSFAKPARKELKFKCLVPNCTRAFRSNTLMQDHIVSGHQGKRFQCNDCRSSFESRAGLRAHRKKHTAPTEYMCEMCFKNFSYKSSYLAHKTTHTSDKDFSCEICGKPYKRLAELKRHMVNIHKPSVENFQCNKCGKYLKTKVALSTHLRNVHAPQLFTCEMCDLKPKFSSRSGLYKHKRRIHKILE